jgi:hypothetical protein
MQTTLNLMAEIKCQKEILLLAPAITDRPYSDGGKTSLFMKAEDQGNGMGPFDP